ncbi:XTP/dITP diphosphatase [Aciduricibacillus chroicocephali]|uniref:dITP/XTP pyrophosphatase n=1 Tax=Aciduricibacillus chroicocephali TaxID=3054939 RepID=A0ABY9KT55_9BACI|nr:XTP/dITP diphosphatase [Bacillaceae bacterium 44XB]
MKEIVIATKNKGKAAEFRDFFGAYGIKALSLLDLPEEMPDVEETGTTFEENAALKAEAISKLLNKTVLSDDSGLVIDALDGRPGVYSARYSGEGANDAKNVEKVLHELEHIAYNNRTARFVSVLAVATPGKETIFKEGSCEGHISFQPQGKHGFGYDPIFVPDGYVVTMAQLSGTEKNRISHRKHAMDRLNEWIQQELQSL